MEVHNPTWVPNLKYIDTFCAQKCCSSLALKVSVCANDTEGRKGGLMRVLSAGSPASLSDRPTLYLNKMCSITLVLRRLWGKKPSSHPYDDPLKLCTAITSLRLEATVRGKKCFMSPGHSSIGCWQRQQKQSGWKRSWSKKWYYQDTSYVSRSLSCSLQVSHPKSPTGFPEKPLKYLKSHSKTFPEVSLEE